jgi:cytochrome c-type biogenesis protein CcmH/NrfG
VEHAGYKAVADNAHDYPLQLAAGVGIAGAVMLYGVFIWAAVRSWRTVFARAREPGAVVLGAFWAAAAGYLLHLLAGVSVTGSTFLLWVALGVVLVPTAHERQVRPPRWGAPAAVLTVALLGLCIGVQFLPLAADNAYVRSLNAGAGPERTELARRAARLNPWNGDYRAAVGLAYEAEVRLNLKAGIEAERAGLDTVPYLTAMREKAAQAESAFRDAIAFAPDEIDYYVMLADLFNLAGGVLDEDLYDQAAAVAREGIAMAPHDPLIRVQLARALLKTGKTHEGVQELEETLGMDPANGEAALLLAVTLEEMGRPDEALKALEAAEARRPGQPGVAEAIARLRPE